MLNNSLKEGCPLDFQKVIIPPATDKPGLEVSDPSTSISFPTYPFFQKPLKGLHHKFYTLKHQKPSFAYSIWSQMAHDRKNLNTYLNSTSQKLQESA